MTIAPTPNDVPQRPHQQPKWPSSPMTRGAVDEAVIAVANRVKAGGNDALIPDLAALVAASASLNDSALKLKQVNDRARGYETRNAPGVA